MREAIFETIARHGAENPDIWFLTGDLGFAQLDCVERALGTRFLNVGVAEQNLISVATGLAVTGRKVFTYSIGPFAAFRAADQIRMGPVLHELDITVITGGSGLSYGTLGYSHYCLDDVGLMRSLPGVTVFTPTTEPEVTLVAAALIADTGPKYVRLERAPIAGRIISLADDPFCGSADAVIVGYGAVLAEALLAAEELEAAGFDVPVMSVPVFDETTTDLLEHAVRQVGAVVSVEEHSPTSGLGAAIALLLASRAPAFRFRAIGTDARVLSEWGSPQHLRRRLGLDATSIASAVSSLVGSGAR
jgi:transketolase